MSKVKIIRAYPPSDDVIEVEEERLLPNRRIREMLQSDEGSIQELRLEAPVGQAFFLSGGYDWVLADASKENSDYKILIPLRKKGV